MRSGKLRVYVDLAKRLAERAVGSPNAALPTRPLHLLSAQLMGKELEVRIVDRFGQGVVWNTVHQLPAKIRLDGFKVRGFKNGLRAL